MKYRFFYLVSIFNLIAFTFYLFSFTRNNEEHRAAFENKILKVRGIVVVDSLGLERVIIGAHLPEPNLEKGYRVAARGKAGSVSGIMLYDHEGQERGGYVTDDNNGLAFLTLDSKTQQHFLLLSEPQGGAFMNLWDRNQNSIQLGTYEDDSFIKLNKNGNSLKLYNDEE
jgi:hypothetical protein